MNEFVAQLFIMPFAGGSRAAFKEFESFVADDIEVMTIEYPGRGSRMREPFCDSMDQMIEDAKRQVEAGRRKELPFALMGYSMGSEIAFDLVQYALEEEPAHLFFCARESIQYDTKGHDYALLDRKDFAEKIVSLGGIDDRILNDKRFLEAALRPIYADYKLLHDYGYKESMGQLKQDITVFYCEKDTPWDRIEPWKYQTGGKTAFYEMGDSHFFIYQHGQEMADIISEQIHAVSKGDQR